MFSGKLREKEKGEVECECLKMHRATISSVSTDRRNIRCFVIVPLVRLKRNISNWTLLHPLVVKGTKGTKTPTTSSYLKKSGGVYLYTYPVTEWLKSVPLIFYDAVYSTNE